MKHILLVVFVFYFFSQASASDTLTVSQVFEFAAGDTFDYRHIDNYNNQQIDETTYSRITLIDRQISIAGDSITDTWRTVYPDTTVYIQIYHGINKHIDTYKYEVYGGAPYILGVDTPAQWDSVRYMFGGSTPGVVESEYFTKGLGMTFNSSFATNNGGHFSDELIYYNKGGRKSGTPYYTLPNSLISISGNATINIHPTPTSHQLHLSISNAGQHNDQFILTNILGQKIYSSTITQSETIHDISKLTSGIYTWRVVENNNIIKTGKIIKE